MVESVTGAIFVDSGGSLDAARDVLQKLGILPLLEHIIADDVDVLHPVSQLSLWAQKNEYEITYETTRNKGMVRCSVMVDNVEEAMEEVQWRGKPSQEEVKYNVGTDRLSCFPVQYAANTGPLRQTSPESYWIKCFGYNSAALGRLIIFRK